MDKKLMFSSKSEEWSTPTNLFEWLDSIFGFSGDAAASKENAKTGKYFTKEQDALQQDWTLLGESVWLNPPYGRGIKKWVEKAYKESQKGITVVCLIPARTETNWWYTWVLKAYEIWFLRGRLKFSPEKTTWDKEGNSAPFPSAIVIFSNAIREVPDKEIPKIWWVKVPKEL